ncbi:MAG: DUF1326 domain-containing protein [Acidobacteria bacterium]|nr:DUF1326 domain-containing protein [Acidobacteriota bacterium]
MKSCLFALLSGSLLLAGGLPQKQLRGTYVEARTADVFVGPCFANSEVENSGNLAVMGWKISEGSWDGVKLDGLGVVGVVKASATLGDVHHTAYPVKSVLIVDERASPEQRLALASFAKRMSKDLLSDVVTIMYRPISLTVENENVHTAKATLRAGDLAAIQTRAMKATDHVCSHEDVWYQPLTEVQHAMPAFAMDHHFKGKELGTTWSSPNKSSAFVANWQLSE